MDQRRHRDSVTAKPRKAPSPVPEPLVDPDCRDGKHRSCTGGPCECSCHVGARSCNVPGCEVTHLYERGLCVVHWTERRDLADPEESELPTGGPRAVSVTDWDEHARRAEQAKPRPIVR